ncbi:MAG: hypothetical protein ACJ8CB_19315 [Ktedonobacteraceae bacterium]
MYMKPYTFSNDENLGKNLPVVPAVKQALEEGSGPLKWWYRLTAPPPAPENANLEQREKARRGRLTSATLLVVILLLVAAVPVGIFGPNHVVLFILLIPFTIDFIALLLNRAGKIFAAGIVVVIGIEVGIGLSIIGPSTSVGLSTYLLPQFDLLVQAEFVAVSLLPPRSVFLFAVIHSTFIFIGVFLFPHTPEFSQTLAVNGYEVFLRPLTLQFIVATVTYLWVTGAQQAIARADRAEEIAALEQQTLALQERELDQKRQIDYGVQQILQTHVLVANGNFKARAPLAQDNILWQIAWSLNNLLARLQHYHQLENEQKRTAQALEQFVEAIRIAKATGQPISIERTGTIIDRLIIELNSIPPRPPSPPARGQVPPVQRGFQQR